MNIHTHTNGGELSPVVKTKQHVVIYHMFLSVLKHICHDDTKTTLPSKGMAIFFFFFGILYDVCAMMKS